MVGLLESAGTFIVGSLPGESQASLDELQRVQAHVEKEERKCVVSFRWIEELCSQLPGRLG